MDIYEYIEQMQPFIHNRDWNGLEAEFEKVAISLAGKEHSSQITAVDVSDYQSSLSQNLFEAVEKAQLLPARAIYFEYDLDNDWDANFFICQDYMPKVNYNSPDDDDWACDWIDEVKCEGFSSFADLYIPGFDSTETAKGNNLYLIARTVATFGRCCEGLGDVLFAVCMAFHDQEPIMRIYEPK